MLLLKKLDGKCAARADFHIYPLMTHVALDMITECACGEVRDIVTTSAGARLYCALVISTGATQGQVRGDRWARDRCIDWCLVVALGGGCVGGRQL